MTPRTTPASLLRRAAWLAAGLAVAFTVHLFTYRPDRPLPVIEPGTSDGPAFVVQVIRPRLGLPLGGILPPGLFGVDDALRFSSSSPGAVVRRAELGRLELAADGWSLVLVADAGGDVGPDTEIVFDLMFEGRTRAVRCRPAEPAVGTFTASRLDGADELSGRFDIELARCEDAATGKALGWPPKPFVLHGSFDRLLIRDTPH